MIQLPDVPLPTRTRSQLDKWQVEIDALADYGKKVEAAKKKFANRNSKKNVTFGVVRETLAQMCSGARRCGYCEDSFADEVEHIWPKDLYPEKVFVWENYLYACGPCNGPKNNRFAVFSVATNQKVEVGRKEDDPIVAPEPGNPVLLNPREDNPLDYLELDLLDTFLFRPKGAVGSQMRQRAEYTIEVLHLNDREYLFTARVAAYQSYKALLYEYVHKKKEGVPKADLDTSREAVRNQDHPTVWKEMQRQHALIPELKELFEMAPEALDW